MIEGDVLAEAVREIPGPMGPLEAMIDLPAGTPRAAVVFAHPLPIQGGTMHTKVVFQGTKALSRVPAVQLSRRREKRREMGRRPRRKGRLSSRGGLRGGAVS
jgi:hypothetical protein